MGDKLYDWLHADQWVKRSGKTEEYLQQIYPREDKEKRRRQFWSGKIILLLSMVLAGILLFLYCFTAEPAESMLKGGGQVQRQEGDSVIRMTVTAENEGGSWRKEMAFPVKQRKFTREEKAELEKQVHEYLMKALPGKNESLKGVTRPLQMPDRAMDGEVELAWFTDEQYLNEDGSLKPESIPRAPIRRLWRRHPVGTGRTALRSPFIWNRRDLRTGRRRLSR